MNNFLSQIIATNQGAARVIQPRVASLFEPVVPNATPIFSDDAMPVESASQRPAEEKHAVAVDATNAPMETPTPSIQPTKDPRLIVENNSQTQSSTQSIAQPNVLLPQPNHPTSSEPIVRREIVESQRIVVNQPVTEIMPIKSIESRREIVSMVEPVSARRATVPASVIVRPNITQIEQAPTNDSSPTPVIRVTIGRIDVRANFVAPTLAPRVTPPTPKLSLDEYLKSQRRGDR